MYKIPKQILTPQNLRLIISKYCSSQSPKSNKKFENIKTNSKKVYRNNKQLKSKTLKILTSNVVMDAFNVDKTCESEPNNFHRNLGNNDGKYNLPLAYSKYRYWQTTTGGRLYYEKPNIEQGTEFSLVSYNILAQDLLEGHMQIYNFHQRDALPWPSRLYKLTEELLTLKPEIICLQEVQNDHLESLKSRLSSLNCECLFKKKTGFRTDGCAIFYNRDKFELKHFESIELFQPNIERLDKENVVLVAKLCPKNDPENTFLVATTHLLYNPKRQDIRLAQVQVLLSELDRLSFKGFFKDSIPERYPIILTGDYNLQPNSAPYKLLTSGELEYSSLHRLSLEKPHNNNSENLLGKYFLPPHLGITDNCQHLDVVANNYTKPSRLHHSNNVTKSLENISTNNQTAAPLFSSGCLKHGLNLKSAYHHYNNSNYPFASTYQDEWITVDYIFYSKQYNYELDTFNDSNLKLLSRYVLPTVAQCNKMGMIPNSRLGSDHLALAVNFFLKTENKNS